VEKWDLAFYDDARGHAPVYVWLKGIPPAPRGQLLRFLAAVAATPPYRVTPSNMWQPMKKKPGGIDMTGFFETRDKHDKTLYRIICLLDRDAPDWQQKTPLVVALHGVAKPVETVVPDSEYEKAKNRRDDYLKTRRVVEPVGIPADLMPKG
jgi:hypothetical protein